MDFDPGGGTAEGGTTASSGDATTNASAAATSGDGSTSDSALFDVGALDVGSNCGAGGELEFSYIWIANDIQGTISKVDTRDVDEVGRYFTHPSAGGGSPSRTSVNLDGDAAVANRNGGVTKFYARETDCQDTNGTAGIQTSTGAADILDWGEEECVAWHTPTDYTSQRPIAWAQRQPDAEDCPREGAKLWVSGAYGPAEVGIDVLRLNGDDGTIEDVVNVPEVVPTGLGGYGGAVDGDGNFWISQHGIGKLVRVTYADLEVDVWDMENTGYGMTVDSAGRPWTCAENVSRFDPLTETWTTNFVDGGLGGCMSDGNGLLWTVSDLFAVPGRVIAVDTETLAIQQEIDVPGVKGLSIDFEGYIWSVQGQSAHKADPDTGAVESYTGLDRAYTYSDMTGFALKNAGTPAG